MGRVIRWLARVSTGVVAGLIFVSSAPARQPVPDDFARAQAAAANVVGSLHPLTQAATLAAGQEVSVWDALPPAAANAAAGRAPDIGRDVLAGVEDRAPVRNADQNYYEARAYNHLLVLSHRTSPAAFAASARKDITFAHLFEEPEKYRGQVVHIEGRLRRLRKFDAPQTAARQGVPVLYEGWIFGEEYFSNPYCVIISDLPAGVEPAEKMERHVAFDGYSFKRYRYKAGDGWRDAPLLIGRSLLVLALADDAGGAASAQWMLPAFLGLVVATVAGTVGLAWWFRRGDRRVRARLDSARAARFVEPPDANGSQ